MWDSASANLVDSIVYKTGADVDGIGLDTALLDAGGILDEISHDGTAATGALDSLDSLGRSQMVLGLHVTQRAGPS